ncbi:MAG: fluoride efflux transporter CrcB [Sandaracinus sp.]|nr:fluoride efflux transporter CrcB [Sandaracinus sp.]
MQWLLIALGGAAGTLLRYGLAVGTEKWVSGERLPFPVATFAANVLGSFLLGAILVWGEGRTIAGVDARLVLGTGAMGGFTTYSSFDIETLKLFEAGHTGRALLYVGATVLVCLLSGWAGLRLGRALTG